MTTRMPPAERKALLRKSALAVGKKIGYKAVTRHIVAEHAKVSPSLIPIYLGDVATMRKIVLHDGCEDGNIKLILEGVLDGDKLAKKTAIKFKDQIINLLFKG